MAENEALKSGVGVGTGGAGANSEEAAKAIAEAEERMRANELKMAEMNKSWEEKLAEAASRDVEED
jgi:TPP-dependent indolepyruvate ferredoxin oxidoreductase alpha subunit